MATPYASGESVSWIDYSGLSYIDGLLSRLKWGGAVGTSVDLTYSFGGADSVYRAGYGNGELLSGFGSLTSVQQLATNNALQAYANVANISFTEVQDSATVAGDLRFALSDATPTAWAYYPTYAPEGGDVWFSNSVWYDTATPGTYGYMTFLHEIGHALGLEHPHSNNTDLSIDTTRFSVMSYRSYEGAALGGYSQNFFATTPMLHDIAALQYSYGANMSYETGNNVYRWDVGERIYETVWDAGGNDTIDWSNQSSDAVINLNDGEYSQLGPSYWTGAGYESQTFAIAYNAVIENANGGSGDDVLIGNGVSNVLVGGAGNDVLSGGGSLQVGRAGTQIYAGAVGDFDGDGLVDDVLWQSTTNGGTSMWEMEDGAQISSNQVQAIMATSWKIVGLGDFDGDGKDDDILWRRDTDGRTYVWRMEDGAKQTGGVVQATMDTAWDVVGLGDFDGDGLADDALWQRSTDGRTYIWRMEDGVQESGGVVQATMDTAWDVVGLGDFDGDGLVDDVLWQRSTDGRTYIWRMEDGAKETAGVVQATMDTAWDVVGLGDFDGDGLVDDVLWQRSTDGRTYIWRMEDGAKLSGGVVQATFDTDWQFEAMGDFDGDGLVDDVLWRNTVDGSTQIWEMANGRVATTVSGGHDTLTGGTGDDLFLFADGDGITTVTDFSAGAGSGDVLNLSAFAFLDFAAVLGAANEDGSSTTITLDADDSIILIGVRIADLNQGDIVLV